MKRNFITGIVVGGLVFGSVGAFAGQYVATENPFPVRVNYSDVDIEGYNIEGSTYFKLRDIGKVAGFETEFIDNTIQILINQSKSSAQATQQNTSYSKTSNDLKYYSRPSWCPDFGAYTGAEIYKKLDNGFMYYATQEQIDDYAKLLMSLGFVKGKIEDKTTYVKDNFYFVSFADDNPSVGIWGFVPGAGDWVSESFVAD